MLSVIGIGLEKQEIIGIGLKRHISCIPSLNTALLNLALVLVQLTRSSVFHFAGFTVSKYTPYNDIMHYAQCIMHNCLKVLAIVVSQKKKIQMPCI